jgi:tetratricopeptide (TPR) repeat protein
MKILRTLCLAHLVLLTFPVLSQVSADTCGPLGNGFGPFDYRADHQGSSASPGADLPYAQRRVLIDGAHFTPRVENLIGAQSGGQIGPPGADLDYTLRAFPNHHRALLSVMRYGEKMRSFKPEGLRWVVECYFERAIRFKSDDAIVRILYSTYLTQNNRQPEAVAQLERATALAGDNPFTHFNVGLTYFDMKLYDKALTQAHKAMELGFTRVELQDLLKGVNKWQEPKIESTLEPKVEPKVELAVEPKPQQ